MSRQVRHIMAFPPPFVEFELDCIGEHLLPLYHNTNRRDRRLRRYSTSLRKYTEARHFRLKHRASAASAANDKLFQRYFAIWRSTYCKMPPFK